MVSLLNYCSMTWTLTFKLQLYNMDTVNGNVIDMRPIVSGAALPGHHSRALAGQLDVASHRHTCQALPPPSP